MYQNHISFNMKSNIWKVKRVPASILYYSVKKYPSSLQSLYVGKRPLPLKLPRLSGNIHEPLSPNHESIDQP